MFKSILSLVIAFPLVTYAAFAQSTEKLGEKYALIIGVKGYPGFPESDRLKYVDEDAQLFMRFLYH
jgi:hypothetical protein